MHDIHESSFDCQFDSASRRRVARIRAWDAEEALELFEVELRADGIEEPGELAVAPIDGSRRPRARIRRHRAV